MSEETPIHLTGQDIAIMVYAMGAFHASVFLKEPNPIALAMARASLPLCRKLGLDIDENIFGPNPPALS
jgi:hypothetical protein